MRSRCPAAWPAALTLALTLVLARAADAKLVLRRLVLHDAKKTTVRAVEARVQMHEGDPITYDTLDQAKERLLASGLFSRVDVWVDIPREEAVRRMYFERGRRSMDLHVRLEEKHSWFVFPIFSAGGSDVSGGLVYVDRNLGGHGVELAGAGQIGQSHSFVLAGFRDPMMTFAPFTYALGGVFRRQDYRFFDDHAEVQTVPTQVAGGEAQFGYVFSSHTRALVGTMIHRQWIWEPSLLALETGQAAPAPYGCPDGTLLDAGGAPAATAQPYNCGEGNIVAVLFYLTYDRTVAPIGLRKGAVVSFKNEIGDSTWGSDFDYVKLDFRLGLYGYLWKTYPSAVLRSAFVFPTSAEGVPLTQILRVGGPDLRGFSVNEFHGDTLVSLQLEEQIRLFELRKLWRLNVVFAVFGDTAALLERHPGGRVNTDPMLAIEPRARLEDFHTSAGGGVRFLLPGIAIPAIRLDAAYGFDVRDYAITFTVASN